MKKYAVAVLSVLTMLLSGCEKAQTQYQMVDLGLSVKWAKVNIGATTTNGHGDYFAWGEVTTKKVYSKDNYKWYDKENKQYSKYCMGPGCDNPDNLTELQRADDAASVIWGDGWRMPTYKEVMELVTECDWVWSSVDGVKGYKVSGRKPGYEKNYIFLPASGSFIGTESPYTNYDGSYWASTNRGGDACYQARCLSFDYSGVSNDGYTDGIVRTVGASIRPVHK